MTAIRDAASPVAPGRGPAARGADRPESRRGRPRDPALYSAVIEAARSLLIEGGYSNLSFEAITQATGVSRAAIYRRWPSKAHLAREVASEVEERMPDTIDVDGLEAQLRASVASVFKRYSRRDASAATIGLIGAYQLEPRLRQVLNDPLEFATRAHFDDIVSRGKARSLIGAHVHAETLFDMMVGAIFFRLLMSSLPADETIVEQVTATLLDGIRA